MYDDELMHYGVLGMKWGVRRTSKPSGHKTSRAEKLEYQDELDRIE